MSAKIEYPYELLSEHPFLSHLKEQYAIIYSGFKASEDLLIKQANDLKEKIKEDLVIRKAALKWEHTLIEKDGWRHIKAVCISPDVDKEGISEDYLKDKTSRQFKVIHGLLIFKYNGGYHMMKGLNDKRHTLPLEEAELSALENNLIPENWTWGSDDY